MNKTVKNVVMVFTLLAAIFLIAFCIELILVNRDTDEEATPSGTIIQYDEQEVSPQDDEQNGENGEENGYNGEIVEIARAADDINLPVPGYGSRFLIEMIGTDLTLVAYADEDFFEYFEEDYAMFFVYTQGGSAALEVSFELIPPEGMLHVAENMLIGFLDGGEPRVIGEGYIGNSSLRGFGAVGEREDGVSFEAWAHEVYGRLAVRIIISYENEAQRAALHAIIDSMEMEGLEDDDEEELESSQ